MVVTGEVGAYLINPSVLWKCNRGGEHFSFNTGCFLGRETTLSEVPTLTIVAITRATIVSPTFSAVLVDNWLKKVEKLLDPSVANKSTKQKRSNVKDWELDDTSKTSLLNPQTSDSPPIDSLDNEPSKTPLLCTSQKN